MSSVSAMHAYFKERTGLGGLCCVFSCDPDCLRPGCKSENMQVPVTVFDVIGAALHRDEPVDDVYRRNYHAGLVPVEGQDWIMRLSLKSRKPCVYLRDGQCTVYAVRPLSCILFPEAYIVDGTAETLAGQAPYAEYPCLQSRSRVGKERAEVIRRLRGMLQKELLVSDHYLFGRSPFYIDLSNLHEKLAETAGYPPANCGRGGSVEGMPVQALDTAFAQICTQCRPLVDLGEKIDALKEPNRQVELFHLLENDKHLKKLFRSKGDEAHVFRFVNGTLQGKRKSLIPPESRFM